MKRRGLRFYSGELPSVEYIVGDTKGTGQILNLSTSGCAIGSASDLPAVDANISVLIAFSGQGGIPHEFAITARVVRTSENQFAVEFQGLEDDKKEEELCSV